MKSRGWLWLVAISMCWRLSAAQAFDLYISNHLFQGAILKKQGTIYVEAVPLAKALGLATAKKEKSLSIGQAPAQSESGKVTVNGEVVQGALLNQGKTWYVPLKLFVQQAGYKLFINSQTKIIDIVPGNSLLTEKAIDAFGREMRAGGSMMSFSAPASVQPELQDPAGRKNLMKFSRALKWIRRLKLALSLTRIN